MVTNSSRTNLLSSPLPSPFVRLRPDLTGPPTGVDPDLTATLTLLVGWLSSSQAVVVTASLMLLVGSLSLLVGCCCHWWVIVVADGGLIVNEVGGGGGGWWWPCHQ